MLDRLKEVYKKLNGSYNIFDNSEEVENIKKADGLVDDLFEQINDYQNLNDEFATVLNGIESLL